MAVSYAALPTLAQFAASTDMAAYRRTLAQVLRLVMYLSIPAAVGLFVLADPVVRLVFEHGAFTATDTAETARALRVYAVGLSFAAIDWPLNYAYYARQNTLTPTVVGIIAIGVYLVVALSLMGPLGMVGLVWGDTAKHFSHALIMTALTRRDVGRLEHGVWRTLGRVLVASAVMALAVWQAAMWAEQMFPMSGLVKEMMVVLTAVGVGAGAYLVLTLVLRLEEPRMLLSRRRQG